MTDRTPEQIRDEAQRILTSEILKTAVDRVKHNALQDLLSADGEDADRIRRERAYFINAVDAVMRQVEAQMNDAEAQLRIAKRSVA